MLWDRNKLAGRETDMNNLNFIVIIIVVCDIIDLMLFVVVFVLFHLPDRRSILLFW